MRSAPLLLACLLAACGGQVDGSDGPTTTAPATPPVADVPSPPPPSVTTPRLSGNVSLLSAGGQLVASAIFPLAGLEAPPTLGPDCVSRTATGVALDSASAGNIVIDVPSEARSLDLAYDATKRAYSDASFEGIVPASSPIHVRASGGSGVPAFDVEIAAAEEARLDQPADGAPILRDSGDLDVRWTPMKEQLLVVSLNIVETTISCRFGATVGHGVIPSALIRQAVKAADSTACLGPCTSLTVFTGHTTKATAGTYDVFVTHGASVSRALTLAK